MGHPSLGVTGSGPEDCTQHGKLVVTHHDLGSKELLMVQLDHGHHNTIQADKFRKQFQVNTVRTVELVMYRVIDKLIQPT